MDSRQQNMNTRKSWLTASIFCPKKDWGRFLQTSITPFITEMKAMESAFQYYLEFNHHDGDNIRLAIQLEDDAVYWVSQRIVEHFKRYQNGEPSSNLTELPIQSVFVRPSSIQIGFYALPKLINGKIQPALALEMSNILIEALSGESFDEEILVTYSFYLYLGWLKAVLLAGTVTQIACALHQFDYAYLVGEVPGINEQNKSADQSLLLEIFDDVMAYTPYRKINRIPNWNQKWIRLCIGELKKTSSFPDFFLIPNFIGIQLSLTKQNKTALAFLISRTLASQKNIPVDLFVGVLPDCEIR